jgi:hypothetical protein
MTKRTWRSIQGDLQRAAQEALDNFDPEKEPLPAHHRLREYVSYCPACGKWLAKSLFYGARRRDGTSTYCRRHQKQYSEDYRRRHR